MKTKKQAELSGDDAAKAEWARVTDPLEALCVLEENQTYIGTDPYYRDLDAALWKMVERVLKAHGK